jgi:hypothetical protein
MNFLKIINDRARQGKFIKFNLKESKHFDITAYTLTIENTKKKGAIC